MTEWLHDLADWTVAFADSDWAIGMLALVSFSEAIFFPVPPDPLLMGIALVQQPLALWLAVLATVSSVAGAMVGHWLGKRLGRPILDRLFSEGKVMAAERWLGRYGVWATVLAAFTPIPYKVFAVTAGVLDLDRRSFALASLVGRGARFLTIGVLVMLFGEEIQEFITGNFELLTIAGGLGVVALAVAWHLFHRMRTRRERVGGEGVP